jgi:hypothetical protein
VTIGTAQRPFSCHVCDSTVFTGHKVRLETAVSRGVFADDAINLVCSVCRYVHTFMPGMVQVWKAADGYPEATEQSAS